MKNFFFFLLMVGLLSCTPREKIESNLFEKAEARGRVSWKLEEASGLVASMANPGYLWTLNDSGNPGEIFLLDDKADIVLTCKLKKIHNRDWEDITIGPGPVEGVNYLYLGEIGDNDAKYEFKYLYRLKEPVFDKDSKMTIEEVDTLVIQLHEGARDMESMTTDHSNGDIYLISKREENVNLYLLESHLLIKSDTLVPEEITSLPFTKVVAADFSFDGNELLIKTYDEIYYWKKPDSLTMQQTLLSKPEKLNYKYEPQGESIAWTLDGAGFYTLSESVDNERARLYFYKKIK